MSPPPVGDVVVAGDLLLLLDLLVAEAKNWRRGEDRGDAVDDFFILAEIAIWMLDLGGCTEDE